MGKLDGTFAVITALQSALSRSATIPGWPWCPIQLLRGFLA